MAGPKRTTQNSAAASEQPSSLPPTSPSPSSVSSSSSTSSSSYQTMQVVAQASEPSSSSEPILVPTRLNSLNLIDVKAHLKQVKEYYSLGGKLPHRQLIAPHAYSVLALRVEGLPTQIDATNEQLLTALHRLHAPVDVFATIEKYKAIVMKTPDFDYADCVSDFIIAFQNLNSEITENRPTDKQLVDLFLAGLRPAAFRTTISLALSGSELSTVIKLTLARAVELDRANVLAASLRLSSPSLSSPIKPFHSSTPSVAIADPTPYSSRSSPAGPKKCFGCAHVGHKRFNCPNKHVPGFMSTGVRRNPLKLEFDKPKVNGINTPDFGQLPVKKGTLFPSIGENLGFRV